MGRLLCLVGIHRPVLPGEWNLGYCFSTCRHCDRDMVRSVLNDRWLTPKEFRVVRHSTLVAYDDLDAFLRAREKPRPPAPRIERSSPVPRARPAKIPPGSPYDFSDFDAAPPGAAPPPLKNVQNG